MERLILAIFLGFIGMSILGGQFFYNIVNDPIGTFHSLPLWTWGFLGFIFIGGIMKGVEDGK